MSKVDVPVEVKFKANLAKAKKDYANMNEDQLEARYFKIVAYLKATIHDKTVDGKALTPDGKLYRHEDWLLALLKYEMIEDEINKRGMKFLIRKVFPDPEIEQAKKEQENGKQMPLDANK